jgi:hypothetical protein
MAGDVSRRQQGACVDFMNFKIYRLNPSEVLIGVEFVYVFIWLIVHAYCGCLRCIV